MSNINHEIQNSKKNLNLVGVTPTTPSPMIELVRENAQKGSLAAAHQLGPMIIDAVLNKQHTHPKSY